MTTPDQPQREPETASDETVLGETTVTVKRSPRIVNFIVLGAIVGALAAVVLTYAFPENARFSTTQVLGFLLLGCIAAGMALGSVVALLIGRIVARKSVTVVADRLGAHAPDAVTAPEAPASGSAESGAAPEALPSGSAPFDATTSGSEHPGSTPSNTTTENSK